MFSHGSSSSISFAIVTPSLVMVGAPHFLSRTTLRPLGPSVTRTASARRFTPRSSPCRASESNFTIFGMYELLSFFQSLECTQTHEIWTLRCTQQKIRLAENRENVAGREDEELLTLELDLGAAVLRVDDTVAL